MHNEDVDKKIGKYLDQLTMKQKSIISRRFGLRGHEESTLEQVGKEVGLTRERVRQIQVEALRELQLIINKEKYIYEDLEIAP